MNPFYAFRDVWVIARFEVLRALRTWRALALCVLYAVATSGATFMFIKMIGAMENALADQMGVAKTKTPGAMLDALMESDMFTELLGAMVGSEHLVERLLGIPVLAMFFLWFTFMVIPFFAATAASESIANDVGSRAIRFEILRTGRLEFVLGRFGGQALLTGVAMIGAACCAWSIGITQMRGHSAIGLASAMGWMGLRGWLFSLPYIGIGLAVSQWTRSSAWARVLAIAATGGTWVIYWILLYIESEMEAYAHIVGSIQPLLPQGWISVLWEPTAWLGAGLALIAISLVALGSGMVVFHRRDL